MRNEAAALPGLLSSLAALDPAPAEILAVNGGSTDASVAIALAAGLRVIRNPTRGRAAQINQGVAEVAPPIVCILHADTLLPDDAVAVMDVDCGNGPCCPLRRRRQAVRLKVLAGLAVQEPEATPGCPPNQS